MLEDELDSGAPALSTFRLHPQLTQLADGVYVDLLENPERFTGYAGDSSSRVWKAIYEENCFTSVPFIDPARSTSDGGSGYAPLSSLGGGLNAGSFGENEKKLFGSLAGPRDGGDEVCLEKRVFYRLISGAWLSSSLRSIPSESLIPVAPRPPRVDLDPHLRRLSRPDDRQMGASRPRLAYMPR